MAFSISSLFFGKCIFCSAIFNGTKPSCFKIGFGKKSSILYFLLLIILLIKFLKPRLSKPFAFKSDVDEYCEIICPVL